MKNYLVIAELINTGYIIGTYDDFPVAKAKSDELFTFANNYPIDHIRKFSNYLKYFQSYPINGNEKYIGKSQECTSNGLLSVYVIDVPEQDFSLKQFISERANTSYAVFSVDEVIPDILIYAN